MGPLHPSGARIRAPGGAPISRAACRHIRGSPALPSVRNAPRTGRGQCPHPPPPAPRLRAGPTGAHRPGSSPTPTAQVPRRREGGARAPPPPVKKWGRRPDPPRARAVPPCSLPLLPRWPTGSALCPHGAARPAGVRAALQVRRNAPEASRPGLASELSNTRTPRPARWAAAAGHISSATRCRSARPRRGRGPVHGRR